MTPFKKYRAFLSKTLLVAGYVLLFATQVNYRFYDIANFFEYHHNSRLTAGGGNDRLMAGCGNDRLTARGGEKFPSGAGKATAVQTNPDSRNAAHLGLDKRYAAKHFISLPSIDAPVVASHEVIERKYALLLKVYSTSDLPTNALRGPPVA
jgi:hypothetical protein